MEIEQIINKTFLGDSCKIMSEFPDNCIDLTISSPPYDCYSDDTEILTEVGWKLIKDIKYGESVLTLNPYTKTTYYQNVVETFNYKIDDNIIQFKNQNIDLKVTKNHNMYISKPDGSPIKSRKLKESSPTYLRKANSITDNCYIQSSGYNRIDEETEYFILPKVECIYCRQERIFEAKKIPMYYWMQFIGIYLAEGSCSNTKNKSDKIKSYEISIKQKDIEAVNLIRNILFNLPFHFKEDIDDRGITVFSITDRQLWDYLFKLGNSHEKYIPCQLKKQSNAHITEMLKYMYLGDGTKNRNFIYDELSLDMFDVYSSVSSKLLDDIQECMIKIGYITKINGRHLSYNKTKNINYKDMQITNIKYTGNVVCVRVPDHNIIYVRRNGKAIFCGNCMRVYTGEQAYTFDIFKKQAKELARITKKGGIIVWVVRDQTQNGGESLTSMKQALYFAEECGLKLYDTMIYAKTHFTPLTHRRYEQAWEYRFVFSKGKKPNTFNGLREPCKCAGETRRPKWTSGSTAEIGCALRNREDGDYIVNDTKLKTNIWYYNPTQRLEADTIAFKHPATFAWELVRDHIETWTNDGDVVFDPMAGSFNVPVVAKLMNRKYIGIDISKKYYNLGNERLNNIGELK